MSIVLPGPSVDLRLRWLGLPVREWLLGAVAFFSIGFVLFTYSGFLNGTWTRIIVPAMAAGMVFTGISLLGVISWQLLRRWSPTTGKTDS
jgi:hypothetical protein